MMACLFACFHTSKLKKRRRLVKPVSSSVEQRNDNSSGEDHEAAKSAEREHIEKARNPITIPKEKLEESVKSSTDEKDGIGLNLKTNVELPAETVTDELLKQNESKEIQRKEDNKPKETELLPDSNYRYENCVDIEDGFEESEMRGGCCGDEGKNSPIEESFSSLFSLSIESRKQVRDDELGCENEVTSPIMPKCNALHTEKPKLIKDLDPNAEDQSQFRISALSPIETAANWKEDKAKKELFPKDQEKENMIFFQGSTLKLPTKNLKTGTDIEKKLANQEIAVDTSLSSWLVESEGTPFSKASSANSVGNSASKDPNSPMSPQERAVLGELNLQDPSQHSTSSTSPISARGPSPDVVPIIGTIGSYWSRTRQTHSRSGEV